MNMILTSLSFKKHYFSNNKLRGKSVFQMFLKYTIVYDGDYFLEIVVFPKRTTEAPKEKKLHLLLEMYISNVTFSEN